jgi:serine protease inhibitor ecotin
MAKTFIMLKMQTELCSKWRQQRLGGKFILDEIALAYKFTQGMSTMMACPDMS